ncbi:MAG TPA: cache domain-containing protein [Candidatus Hydrogenedentes bacterium]|jgi:signal transduction histidine kinase|nr:cache domain-containing protein [Candidatus Hydrogenedentota bacterium]HPJ98346.1 cache domain-containing protein [Candidatus Hydrogenedentota bacterium]
MVSLRVKFGLFIVLVFGLVTAAMSLLQAHWVRTLVFEQTETRMEQNIHAAWNILRTRQQLLEAHVSALAELGELEEQSEAGTERLEEILQLYRERWGLDFVALTDTAGRVVMSDGALQDGAALPLFGETAAPSGSGRVRSGYAVAQPEVFSAPEIQARLVSDGGPQNAMVLMAQYRLDASWAHEGDWLVAGTVLNGAHQLVDAIHHTIFPSEFYKGKPLGTATIFLGPVRIATTVSLDNGKRALGTIVSDEVAEKVLKRGESWTGPALVVGHWYLSRYEPIRTPDGAVLGMLYIGELRQIYDDIESRTLLTNLTVLFAIMMGALALSFVLISRVLRQVVALDRATKGFVEGDYSARANIETRDELGGLAQSFNRMAATIQGDRAKIMRQNEEIESANRGYMGMLGFATHEFRNSVGAAMLNLQLLKEGSFGKIEGEVFEGIDIVEKSLRYISDISDNFLQLSRIERGELSVTQARVDLNKSVVIPVLQDKKGIIELRKMTLETDIPDGFSLTADPNLIRVALENLVGNAIKYGREGARIVIAARMVGNWAEVSVWNDGPPIPPDQLNSLFEKFWRCDSDTVSSRRGAGLGLFLVKHIVDLHAGQVAVESSEEKGTRFILRFPGS